MSNESKSVTVPGNVPGILDWDSPVHLKRLAKALNGEGWQRSRAFYCDLGKFNQARFSKGALQVRLCSGKWTTVEGETVFDDGNGGTRHETNKSQEAV